MTAAREKEGTARVKGDFGPFEERMAAERLPEIVIRSFGHYYGQLAAGETGLIAEREIRPVESLPDLEQLPADLAEVGRAALPKTVLLKLNGGLGTGMGLERAKTLLMVREGLTFLDIIARQAIHAGVPLVLMNSFNTHDDSLAALARYPELHRDIPLDFLQHKVPKVVQEDLTPARWPADPELEWCPPGHGDIYAALVTSGMLETLLGHGYETIFVANADNLGAELDLKLLGYFVHQRLPFLMEAADRTGADRKGGHLARRTGDGRLVLRESAQCPEEDSDAFQDIERHRYFNTNNLWINLPALDALLRQRDGLLHLPMIRNSKTVDPRDPDSPKVYQLETAMGSAIAAFEGAGALRVPRTRFSPVKNCDDLLAVRSDAYVLTPDWQVTVHPDRTEGVPVIRLDPRFYKMIDQMEARFPDGPPSLIDCARLTVQGDVLFGPGVVCRGAVEVTNPSEAQLKIANEILS